MTAHNLDRPGKSGEGVVIGRIRPALRTAIRLMIEDGMTQVDAARAVGYNPVSLSVALRKPHVKVVVAAVKRAWLENETGKAWQTVSKLAAGAASEDVQLKAAKVILESQGELDGSSGGDRKGPAGLVQIIVNHVPQPGQPLPSRLPGVIEAHPVQGSHRFPSNSKPVGHDDEDLNHAS